MGPLYVFDTNSLSVFGNYYPETFSSFWDQLEALVAAGSLVSCWEVLKEIERYSKFEHLNEWVNRNSKLFAKPSGDEMSFVSDIFKIPHFRQLIGRNQQLTGSPVADPFVVARGAILGGCVVTEEAHRPNAAKIPNVCDHFGVSCTDVKGFLAELGWRF